MRADVLNRIKTLVPLILVPVSLFAGTWCAAKSAVDHLLYHDAIMTGRSWTSYLVENIKDLEEIADGAKPLAESQMFLDRARKAGQVFRYVIYDPEGHTRYIGDVSKTEDVEGRSLKPEEVAKQDLGKSDDDDDDDENLAEHNPAAARAIAAGGALVNAEEGAPPTRPTFFSEAYLPAVSKGKTIAIVETYIDQAEKRTEYQRTLVILSGGLLLLMGAGFGLPGWAWLKRSQEKRLADAHIHFLAHHDSLTRLFNRTRLATALEGRLSRQDFPPFALFCIDIDHFKDVNDTLGHEGGDALLVSMADRLRRFAEKDDIVARTGGDQFVFVRASVEGRERALEIAQQLRVRLSAPYDLNGHATSLTVSIGVALGPLDGKDVSRLMKSADLAAYASKTGGRDRVTLFEPHLDQALAKRLRLERAIRSALAAKAFELHYQPSVDAPTGRLVGFEALLRMRDQEGEMVPPAVFIPLAEHMGLISEIGEWVLREACTAAAQWPEPMKVAVNLSPAQFGKKDLAKRVQSLLSDAGLRPQRLELEITEGLLLTKSADVMEELRNLKALGVSIVMDDFGTGYSSLSYLWQFPFDKIKIDRAFMLALDQETNDNAKKIVRTIIDLGRSLDVTVTVEGVEDKKQADFVTAAGCNQIQGYFFGKPMPATDMPAFIAKHLAADLAEFAPGSKRDIAAA